MPFRGALPRPRGVERSVMPRRAARSTRAGGRAAAGAAGARARHLPVAVVVAVVAALAALPRAQGSFTCAEGWTLFDPTSDDVATGSAPACYRVLDDNDVSFPDARRACAALGARVATFASPAQFSWLSGLADGAVTEDTFNGYVGAVRDAELFEHASYVTRGAQELVVPEAGDRGYLFLPGQGGGSSPPWAPTAVHSWESGHPSDDAALPCVAISGSGGRGLVSASCADGSGMGGVMCERAPESASPCAAGSTEACEHWHVRPRLGLLDASGRWDIDEDPLAGLAAPVSESAADVYVSVSANQDPDQVVRTGSAVRRGRSELHWAETLTLSDVTVGADLIVTVHTARPADGSWSARVAFSDRVADGEDLFKPTDVTLHRPTSGNGAADDAALQRLPASITVSITHLAKLGAPTPAFPGFVAAQYGCSGMDDWSISGLSYTGECAAACRAEPDCVSFEWDMSTSECSMSSRGECERERVDQRWDDEDKAARTLAYFRDEHASEGPCETGWHAHGGHCYIATATPASWDDAQAACNDLDADLASVHSHDENALLLQLLGHGWDADATQGVPTGDGGAWIGARRSQGGAWDPNGLSVSAAWIEWVDRSPLDFEAWALRGAVNVDAATEFLGVFAVRGSPRDPIMAPQRATCVYLGDLDTDRWRMMRCGAERRGICKKPALRNGPLPSPVEHRAHRRRAHDHAMRECPPGFAASAAGDVCFGIATATNATAVGLTSGDQLCGSIIDPLTGASVGARLASVRNADDNQLVASLIPRADAAALLGASDGDADYAFRWRDGTPWTGFDAFADGEPSMPRGCVNAAADGLWRHVPCNTTSSAYAVCYVHATCPLGYAYAAASNACVRATTESRCGSTQHPHSVVQHGESMLQAAWASSAQDLVSAARMIPADLSAVRVDIEPAAQSALWAAGQPVDVSTDSRCVIMGSTGHVAVAECGDPSVSASVGTMCHLPLGPAEGDCEAGWAMNPRGTRCVRFVAADDPSLGGGPHNVLQLAAACAAEDALPTAPMDPEESEFAASLVDSRDTPCATAVIGFHEQAGASTPWVDGTPTAAVRQHWAAEPGDGSCAVMDLAGAWYRTDCSDTTSAGVLCQRSIACPAGWSVSPEGDRCLSLVTTARDDSDNSHAGAKAACEAANAYQAAVRSGEEAVLVQQLAGSERAAWLGLRDISPRAPDPAHPMEWNDGRTPATFSNFAPGANRGADEHCAMQLPSLFWSHADCAATEHAGAAIAAVCWQPTRQAAQTAHDLPRTCMDILHMAPGSASGRYTIYPSETGPSLAVWCDLDTDGGGWTLVHATAEPQSTSAALPTLFSPQRFPASVGPLRPRGFEDPLSNMSLAYNMDAAAKEAVLRAVSSDGTGEVETLLRRGSGGPWLRVDHAPFTIAMLSGEDTAVWPVQVVSSTGEVDATAWMGASSNASITSSGGFLGIADQSGAQGLDDSSPTARFVNAECRGQYLVAKEGGAGASFRAAQALGGWAADDDACSDASSTGFALQVAVRPAPPRARSCLEVLKRQPAADSGAFLIATAGDPAGVQVWCDHDTDGGGFTVVWSHGKATPGHAVPVPLTSDQRVGSGAESVPWLMGSPTGHPFNADRSTKAFIASLGPPTGEMLLWQSRQSWMVLNNPVFDAGLTEEGGAWREVDVRATTATGTIVDATVSWTTEDSAPGDFAVALGHGGFDIGSRVSRVANAGCESMLLASVAASQHCGAHFDERIYRAATPVGGWAADQAALDPTAPLDTTSGMVVALREAPAGSWRRLASAARVGADTQISVQPGLAASAGFSRVRARSRTRVGTVKAVAPRVRGGVVGGRGATTLAPRMMQNAEDGVREGIAVPDPAAPAPATGNVSPAGTITRVSLPFSPMNPGNVALSATAIGDEFCCFHPKHRLRFIR